MLASFVLLLIAQQMAVVEGRRRVRCRTNAKPFYYDGYCKLSNSRYSHGLQAIVTHRVNIFLLLVVAHHRSSLLDMDIVRFRIFDTAERGNAFVFIGVATKIRTSSSPPCKDGPFFTGPTTPTTTQRTTEKPILRCIGNPRNPFFFCRNATATTIPGHVNQPPPTTHSNF